MARRVSIIEPTRGRGAVETVGGTLGAINELYRRSSMEPEPELPEPEPELPEPEPEPEPARNLWKVARNVAQLKKTSSALGGDKLESSMVGVVRLPLVSYQCVAKEGVVLRPTAGYGELHDALHEGLVKVPEGRFRQGLGVVANLGVTALEEGELVPGMSKVVGGVKGVRDETGEENDRLRNWVGSAPTLYGVAVVLLPPVLRVLVERLRDPELGALREVALFEEGELNADEEGELNELQRRLFAKDPEPKLNASIDWPQWGVAPSKAATEGYNKELHKRKTKQSESRQKVIGRSSGDAAEEHIRGELEDRMNKKELNRVVAELFMRWLREREDAQVPPDLRSECKRNTDVPWLYTELNGRKTKTSSATKPRAQCDDEVGSSGPLQVLAGLLDEHAKEAQLSDEQKEQLHVRIGQRVLPSKYPTADCTMITQEEQVDFVSALVAHYGNSNIGAPMEYASLISSDTKEAPDLPGKVDSHKNFHEADDDLHSAYLGWIDDVEDGYKKKERKEKGLKELKRSDDLSTLVKRMAEYHKQPRLKVVQYGETVKVKRVVQFKDGIIRMECAGDHEGKWVTLTRDTALKDVPGGKDRDRNFVVNQYPPCDEETNYLLDVDCKGGHTDNGTEMQREGSVGYGNVMRQNLNDGVAAVKNVVSSPAADRSQEREQREEQRRRTDASSRNHKFKTAKVVTNRWGLTRLRTTDPQDLECWVDFLHKDTGMPVIRRESEEEEERILREAQKMEAKKEASRREQEQEARESHEQPAREPEHQMDAGRRALPIQRQHQSIQEEPEPLQQPEQQQQHASGRESELELEPQPEVGPQVRLKHYPGQPSLSPNEALRLELRKLESQVKMRKIESQVKLRKIEAEEKIRMEKIQLQRDQLQRQSAMDTVSDEMVKEFRSLGLENIVALLHEELGVSTLEDLRLITTEQLFDLRLKPIQRANLEILVDERKRNQSAVDDTSLRMKLVNLEKERKALDEPMAEIKVAKVDVQKRLDALRQEKYRLQGRIDRASDRRYGSTAERLSMDRWTRCLICGVAVPAVDAEEHSERCKLDWEAVVAAQTRQAISAAQESPGWLNAIVEIEHDPRNRASISDRRQAHAPFASSSVHALRTSFGNKLESVDDRYHHKGGTLERDSPQPPSPSLRSPKHEWQWEASSKSSHAHRTPDDHDRPFDSLRGGYVHAFRAFKQQQKHQHQHQHQHHDHNHQHQHHQHHQQSSILQDGSSLSRSSNDGWASELATAAPVVSDTPSLVFRQAEGADAKERTTEAERAPPVISEASSLAVRQGEVGDTKDRTRAAGRAARARIEARVEAAYREERVG